MTAWLSMPQAQLPFVDASGRLTPVGVRLMQNVVGVIQGPGGILDMLAAASGGTAAAGQVAAQTAEMQTQLAALAQQLGMTRAALMPGLDPVAVHATAAGALAPVAIPEHAASSLAPNPMHPPVTGELRPIPPPPGQVEYILLANGTRISAGVGAPNGAIWGSVGDFYTRQDGGSSTTLWVKEAGANSNTGWTAK